MPITATAEPDNAPPRVALAVSGIAGSTVTITRTDPDGRVRPVRTAESATLTGGAWQGFDYEMPFGTPVAYTATDSNGTTHEVVDPVTVDSADLWLIHPGMPDVSVRVSPDHVAQLESRTRAARSTVLEPLGRATPLVVSDVRRSVETGISVFVEDLPGRDALWSLLDTGVPILLNVPPDLFWGVEAEWAAFGDVTEAYWARGFSEARIFEMPYTVVDRPVGALQAQWTYADLLATYSTHNATRVAYPTYSEYLSNSVA